MVTTSSTAEEECPVRETYWTGGFERSGKRSEGGKTVILRRDKPLLIYGVGLRTDHVRIW